MGKWKLRWKLKRGEKKDMRRRRMGPTLVREKCSSFLERCILGIADTDSIDDQIGWIFLKSCVMIGSIVS